MTKWQEGPQGLATHVQPGHQVIIFLFETKRWWNKNDHFYPTKHVFFGGNKSFSKFLPSFITNKKWHNTPFTKKQRFSYSPRDPWKRLSLPTSNTTNQNINHSWIGKNIPVRPMEILCVGCGFLPTNSRISIDLIIHRSNRHAPRCYGQTQTAWESPVVVEENLWDECFGWDVFMVKKAARNSTIRKTGHVSQWSAWW